MFGPRVVALPALFEPVTPPSAITHMTAPSCCLPGPLAYQQPWHTKKLTSVIPSARAYVSLGSSSPLHSFSDSGARPLAVQRSVPSVSQGNAAKHFRPPSAHTAILTGHTLTFCSPCWAQLHVQ